MAIGVWLLLLTTMFSPDSNVILTLLGFLSILILIHLKNNPLLTLQSGMGY